MTAFPDLTVRIVSESASAEDIGTPLQTQILSDDILLCLTEKVPSEDSLERLVITQPHHQQCYTTSTTFSPTELEFEFTTVPVESKLSPIYSKQVFKRKDPVKDFIYDYISRCPLPLRFAHACQDMMKHQGFPFQGPSPSSIVAVQLRKPLLQLEMSFDFTKKTADEGKLYLPVHPKSSRRLRAFPSKSESSIARPPPDKSSLPLGGRPIPPPIPIPQDQIAVHDLTTEQEQVKYEQLGQISNTFCAFPKDVSCSALYNPNMDSLIRQQSDAPIDLVMTIRDDL